MKARSSRSFCLGLDDLKPSIKVYLVFIIVMALIDRMCGYIYINTELNNKSIFLIFGFLFQAFSVIYNLLLVLDYSSSLYRNYSVITTIHAPSKLVRT
jgi:hypothetical protein